MVFFIMKYICRYIRISMFFPFIENLRYFPVPLNFYGCSETISLAFFHFQDGFNQPETVRRFLPFLRRLLTTFLPPFDAILFLNPCVLILFRFDGWNVLFIFFSFLD
jgi:hypothetical protein